MKRKSTNEDDQITTHEEPTQDDLEASSDKKEKRRLNRRQFIMAGTGAAAAIITGSAQAQRPRPRPLSIGPQCVGPALQQPDVYDATTDPNPLTLDASMTKWTYTCGGSTFTGLLPIYNHDVPGPTIMVDPGGTINIDLLNNLGKTPFAKDKCHANMALNPPKPGCFTNTNLHTHGLMVSPCSRDGSNKVHCGPYEINGVNPPLKSSSDDVLLDILPGQTNKYCITLPKFHDSGTYWYHSHLHGASGYQVGSGMAGALIVREPKAEQLVPPLLDKIMLLQEVVFTTNADWPTIYGGIVGIGGAPASQFLINGRCRPMITMYTGRTERWRFINATGTPRGLTKLRLVKVSDNPDAVCNTTIPSASGNTYMSLIAVDGIKFYGKPPFGPQKVKQHLMAPGNRADFLVNIPLNPPRGQVGGPGLYYLVKDSFPLDATNVNSTTFVNATVGSAQQVIAYVRVVASSYYNQTIPDSLLGDKPFYLTPIGNLPNKRTVTFQQPGVATFKINNKFYDPNVVDIPVNVNTAEEWTLANSGLGGGGQSNPHAFHIHVNPFQVVGRTIDFETDNPTMDKNNPCNWMWMDTVALPGGTGANPAPPLKMRTRFLVYSGEFVLHCHLLVHEDVGMMLNVQIKGNTDDPGPCERVGDPPDAAKKCVNDTAAPCRV